MLMKRFPNCDLPFYRPFLEAEFFTGMRAGEMVEYYVVLEDYCWLNTLKIFLTSNVKLLV